MVLIPHCIPILLVSQGGCLAHLLSRLLAMFPAIHRVIGTVSVWSLFWLLIYIYALHFIFMLVLIVIGMTWYELKSNINIHYH